MIRLLLFILTISLLYIGFSLVGVYDATVHISFLQYSITTSTFFLIVSLAIGYITLSIIIRIVALILNAPRLISGRMKNAKFQSVVKDLLDCYSDVLSQDVRSAYKAASALKNELPQDLAKHAYLILSVTDNDSEQRAYHLRYLVENNLYSAFATRELTQYFLKHKYYKQGLEYAQKAIHIGDEDEYIVRTLIELYGELHIWDGFLASVRKLEELCDDIDYAFHTKITDYFVRAAKDALSNGDDHEATGYLEEALTHRPDHLEAIDLICSLNINTGNERGNRRLIETAFSITPSFELFELYFRSVTVTKAEIFATLSSLADPQKYIGVFIAIAAYLELNDNLCMLREMMTKET